MSESHPPSDREPSNGFFETAKIFGRLRMQALRVTAELVRAERDEPVLAVLMEQAYPVGAYTLVSVVDGSASLYFSKGNYIIGAGEHPECRQAALRLVSLASEFAPVCETTTEFPLPEPGHIRFYIVTPKAVLTVDSRSDELKDRHHPLYPFYETAYRVIHEIRLVTEKSQPKTNHPSKA